MPTEVIKAPAWVFSMVFVKTNHGKHGLQSGLVFGVGFLLTKDIHVGVRAAKDFVFKASLPHDQALDGNMNR